MIVLNVATFNLSVAAAKHHPDDLRIQLTRVMLEHDVVLMQEAGKAGAVVRAAAKAAGHAVYFGDGGQGQPSTPVSVKASLSPRFDATPLLPPRDVGRGAGPSRAKAKSLLTATFHIGGVAVTVGNLHAYASQQNKPRALAAMIQFRRALAALDRHPGVHLIGGDLNAIPGARTLAVFRRRGMRSSQRRLGQLGTEGAHMQRAIDDIYYEPGRAKPLAHRVITTVSDHRVYSLRLSVHA